MLRHIKRKHQSEGINENIEQEQISFNSEPQVIESEPQLIESEPQLITKLQNKNKEETNITSIEELLVKVQLEDPTDLFREEAIDLEVLKAMVKQEVLEMMKELGINKYGHRFKIYKALEVGSFDIIDVVVEATDDKEGEEVVETTDDKEGEEVMENVANSFLTSTIVGSNSGAGPSKPTDVWVALKNNLKSSPEHGRSGGH